MKKLITIFLVLLIAASTVFAAPVGMKSVDTDIKVFLNGTQINQNSTFAWNGKMYICANVL